MTDLSYGPFISGKQAKAQGVRHYYTGKPCKYGHVALRFSVSGVCTECNQAHQHKYGNSDKGKATRKRQYEVEKARRAAGDKDFIARRTAACTRWRRNNPEAWSKAVANRNASPNWVVRNRMQTRLHTFLSATGTEKTLSFQEYVGCSPKELVAYLEEQFLEGMDWTNHGVHGWHIDHIQPCASFDLTDPEQQRQCFHYTNLQPLWAEDNLRKSDQWVEAA